jgi:hypothetical protein
MEVSKYNSLSALNPNKKVLNYLIFNHLEHIMQLDHISSANFHPLSAKLFYLQQ